MAYVESMIVLGATNVILAIALDLLIGVAGLFSAASGVFYGIGAYAAAIVWAHVTSNLLAAVVVAFVVGCLVAVPFIVPALRARVEVTFVVASLAFGEILTQVFQSWNGVTGGNEGLLGFPLPTLFGLTLSPGLSLVVVGICLMLVVAGVKEAASRSSWGLDLRAVRNDDSAARSLGVRATRIRIQVAILACGLTALAGVLYAAEIGYVDPSGFGTSESELIAAMVVLGGLASFLGPIVGAIALTAIPAGLTFAPISSALLGPIEQGAYGLLIVLVILFRPEGIVGGFTRITMRFRPTDTQRQAP
ncbi:branched-chain amino acid ABC transporter permease [Conexibacter sp. S30A1]|uniref:branched-chain amino acid ABC transporter permease n=1 Tax=Conexibacter sp. S30A1 TaxID=2937800 RepID=UPI00200CE7A2|nr:branched-chain amino acid ABC transporter permease [Conexibacter sp. S30A1]